MGFLTILQRPDLEGDPETPQILKLTQDAGRLQDLWMAIQRKRPTLLEATLSTRPDDGRNIGQLIMARMDAMGDTCERYLDREIGADALRQEVREHMKVTRALVAEIRADDLGPEPA
jgi:hypothetical protein